MTRPRRTIALVGSVIALIALGAVLAVSATRDGGSDDPPADAPQPTPTPQTTTPTAGRTATRGTGRR